MSNKFLTIILCLLNVLCVFASEAVSVSFYQTPLPSALRTIEQLAGDEVTINFSFRKLEDYTVTTDIRDATALEAINQAVGFYPIKVTCSGSIITVQPLLECEHKITGRLVDEYSEGVDFANVNVLSIPDSMVVASGVSNLRGDFVLPLSYTGEMVLKASRMGYKPLCIRAHLGNMGDVLFQTDALKLRTLTAVADRSTINTVGSVTNIRIEGTPYSNVGTLADLLPNLPGFSPSTSAFGIYGTGPTLYYINGRQVSETTQLNMLRSDQVRSISIDKAPGADYPSDAAVVVNISTKTSAEDFVNLRVNYDKQIRREMSDVPSVDLKVQWGKFTTALNYRYDYLQSKTDDWYQRVIGRDEQIRAVVTRERIFEGKDKGSRLNWSGEIQFDPRNRLGLYYYYYSLDHHLSGIGRNDVFPNLSSMVAVLSHKYGETALHSGTLSYDHTDKVFTAHIAQDLAYTNPYSTLVTNETQKQTETRVDSHSDEYTVSTTNLRLGLNFPSGTLVTAGARLSYVESHTNKLFMENPNWSEALCAGSPYGNYIDSKGDYGYGTYAKYNWMNVTETTAQAFMSISQRLGNLTIMPGIRYEYVDRHIDDNSTVQDPGSNDEKPLKHDYTYDRHYGNWLPSLMLRYSNGPLNMTLNYNRHIVQPTFSMLNSGLVYEDNFTYANSNSELKPTQIDQVRLSAGYRGFSADLGMRSMLNPIAEVELPVPGAGATVYRTPINLRRYNEYEAKLSYSSTYGPLGYYAAAEIIIPGWHDVYYSSKRTTFNAEINLTYRINKHFSLYTNLKHYGGYTWMVFDRQDSQIWNFGASASLLGNRLNINIEGTDLLGRNNLSSIITSYGGVTTNNYTSLDSRGLNIRVSYTLFNKQIRTKVKRGNDDVIDRIER